MRLQKILDSLYLLTDAEKAELAGKCLNDTDCSLAIWEAFWEHMSEGPRLEIANRAADWLEKQE